MALLSERDFRAGDWNDWRWQMRNRITTVEKLAKWIDLTPDELSAIELCRGRYRWAITPYYASLMDTDDPRCPIRQLSVPSGLELQPRDADSIDPHFIMEHQKSNRVVHQYPDRVIMIMTEACPVYCRHCERKYHTTDTEGTFFESGEGTPFDEDVDYIRRTPAIRDVLLTGGDPLVYPDAKLERLIALLRDIPHVKIIRLGTRFPVLLPQRITAEFCEMLEKYHPIWLNTHFNHPREVTLEAARACDRLLRHGVPVGNQAVLLKGINDSADTMRTLSYALVDARIWPYYLYHADNVAGVSHFRTTIEEGREIMDSLIGHIAGFAIPQYITGTVRGKIPLNRQYVTKGTDGGYDAIDYNGNHFRLDV
jgi:lysine 2,3-aminomutase